jgi:hypothetical protein
MFYFEKLVAWQKAIEYGVFSETVVVGMSEAGQVALGDPLRQGALSISAHLARSGMRRGAEAQWYLEAKGAVHDCVCLIVTAREAGYLSDSAFEGSYTRLEALARLIGGLLKSLSKKEAPAAEAAV